MLTRINVIHIFYFTILKIPLSYARWLSSSISTFFLNYGSAIPEYMGSELLHDDKGVDKSETWWPVCVCL